MSNSLATLSIRDLKRALALKEKIARLNKELAGILGSNEPAVAAAPKKAPKKRKMSAEGRAAISRAAKARWAKWKAGKKG